MQENVAKMKATARICDMGYARILKEEGKRTGKRKRRTRRKRKITRLGKKT